MLVANLCDRMQSGPSGASRVAAQCSFAPTSSAYRQWGRRTPIIVATAANRRDRTKQRHRAQRKKGQSGSPERPRLAVYKSNNHIYGQVIDDSIGHTLAAISSLTTDAPEGEDTKGSPGKNGANKDAAESVGKKLAELCLSKNIKQVFLDRGGFRYHGRIKAFADGAREGGLAF